MKIFWIKKNKIIDKENCISQLEAKYLNTLEKNKSFERQLHKEKVNSRDMLIEYECYKEIVNLMERETHIINLADYSKILNENETLVDKIAELKSTISKVTKHILVLQKMNLELKTKLNCSQGNHQDIEVQTDIVLSFGELETKHFADESPGFGVKIASMQMEIDDKEAEVIAMRVKMQDLVAELEQLQRENAIFQSLLKNNVVNLSNIELKQLSEKVALDYEKHLPIGEKHRQQDGVNKQLQLEDTDNKEDNISQELKQQLLQDRLYSLEVTSVETKCLNSSELIKLNDKFMSIETKNVKTMNECHQSIAVLDQKCQELHHQNETNLPSLILNDGVQLGIVKCDLYDEMKQDKNLEKSKEKLVQEKKQLLSQLEILLQKYKEKDLKCQEYNHSLHMKCTEIDELQNSKRELLNSLNQKEREVVELNSKIEDRISEYNILEESFRKITDDLKLEMIKYQNIYSKMEESQKSIERYKVDVAGLKAKFSLNLKSATKKDKEIKQSLKLNISLKENIHKLKLWLKEELNKNEDLNAELLVLKNTLKEKESELNKQINLHKEVLLKLNDTEISIQNLKKKISKLQIEKKKIQFKVSKLNKKPFLMIDGCNKKTEIVVGEEITGFDLHEQQSSNEVVHCSQTGVEHLPESISSIVNFKPLRSIYGRRSHYRRKTTGSIVLAVNKDGKKKSILKSQSPESQVASSHFDDTSLVVADSDLKLDVSAENFSCLPKRVTRLSSSRENIESCSNLDRGKRSILAVESANPKRLKLNIKNSNVEGLPCKTEQGLNNIPVGVESPGVMRRSTTSSFPKINVAQMSPRGPLRLQDSNLCLIHISSGKSARKDFQMGSTSITLRDQPSNWNVSSNQPSSLSGANLKPTVNIVSKKSPIISKKGASTK